MSKRAEEAAYNYAKENGTLGYDYNQIYDAAKNGYEQAEQDLALTWQDIAKIDDMLREVENCIATSDLPTMGRDEYYTEVLKRYNELKNK